MHLNLALLELAEFGLLLLLFSLKKIGGVATECFDFCARHAIRLFHVLFHNMELFVKVGLHLLFSRHCPALNLVQLLRIDRNGAFLIYLVVVLDDGGKCLLLLACIIGFFPHGGALLATTRLTFLLINCFVSLVFHELLIVLE